MSFPAYWNTERRQPIVPNPPSLLGQGPMQSLTTQKHDFVCKSGGKRNLIIPASHIERACAPLERETVQKLSFPVPIGGEKPRSCKPIYTYQQPKSESILNYFYII